METNAKNLNGNLRNPLLVIDNRPIRERAILIAEKWIKKIENLEKSSMKYHETDLKLYTAWYNLTLNPLIEEVKNAENEFLKLAESYNMLVFVASSEEISLPEAFLFLKDEAERYENGSENEKAQIEKAREKRAKDLGISIENEFNSDEGPDYSDIRDRVESELKKIKQKREENADKIAYYENLTDKELFQTMSDTEASFSFIMDATLVLLESSRADLLRKIWEFAPRKLQKRINQELLSSFKKTFEEILHDEEQKALAFYTVLGEDDEDEIDFFGDTIKKPKDKKPFGEPPRSAKPHENEEESRIRTKYLFRKIARKIHPDHLNPDHFENLKNWFDTIWKKVAVAHSRNDYKQLTVLHHKIMVVLKNFDELTISDLEDASQAFQVEYNTICSQISGIKDSPAWNFSKLKSYSKLERQQSRPFLGRLEEMQRKIEELRIQNSKIEQYAKLMNEGKINSPDDDDHYTRRSSRQNHKARKKRSRSRYKDQLDLFD